MMLSFYKNQEFDLVKLDEIVPNCWINAIAPTSEEIAAITALGIPQDFISYSLDKDERSRIEEEDDGTILIVVRIPVYNGADSDIPYSTVPLGIILAEKYIVTVCSQENDILTKFESGTVPKLSTTKRYRFTLRLLMAATTKYLDYVRAINAITDELEDQLIDSMVNTQLIRLFRCQKSYMFFTQALKQNELTLVRLSRLSGFKKYEEDEDLLQDVITENTQAIEMTNISGDILLSMSDAHASIIANNQNVVMKFLASVTIIMELPNVVTGFLGMNISWPDALTSNPLIGLSVLAGLIALTIFMIWFFNKKNWF